jgi:D-alanyl-D-alanine carboxypeptidase
LEFAAGHQDAAAASEAIATGIAPLLLASHDPATIDRSLFTDNANFYFNEQALKDFASSLGPLATPKEFIQLLRGGMKLRVYTIKFPKSELRAWTYEMPDGKLEQFQVASLD